MEPVVNGFLSYLLDHQRLCPGISAEDAFRQGALNWNIMSEKHKRTYRIKVSEQVLSKK